VKSTTHIVAATGFVAVGNIITGNPPQLPAFLMAALTSMLPDIDRPRSKVSRLCPQFSRVLYQTFGHRTITHSIFGWLGIAIIFLPLRFIPIPGIYTAALLGYISHSILDTMNIEGVRLTYPLFGNHCYVLPGDEAHRIKQGSPKEKTFQIVLGMICIGLLGLNFIGERTLFRNLLGTPEAIARDYAHQLKLGERIIVKIRGIWTNGQDRVESEFDVIAANDFGIFVRQSINPMKVYQIGGSFSAISHARLKIVHQIKAEHRVVKIQFNYERWKSELLAQYPGAIVSGIVKTHAVPPRFGLDEFHTIQRRGDEWHITHAPIELLDQTLRSRASLTGEIKIRYWRQKDNERNQDTS